MKKQQYEATPWYLPVTEYFLKVDTSKRLVGFPVYDFAGSSQVIGEITEQIEEKGVVKVRLWDPVDFRFLLGFGVPMEHICFPYQG